MAHLDGFEAESYLKSGANELRVLEYNVCGHSFGINILKVKKIVSHMNQFMAMPESHPAIRGVFEDRGTVVPLIDLAYFLGIPRSDENPPQKVIITEFFEMTNGFWVDRIDWIHHFKWEDVIDPTKVMHGFDQRYVIGIVKPNEERMVLLLDYENIIMDISPHLRKVANTQMSQSPINGGGRRILIAEDSPAVRTMVATELEDIGFEVLQARDGKEALNMLDKIEGSLDLIISDVEMPRMDGLALTVAVRGSRFKKTPVIVYSSIGDIGMKARAKFLKASAHITKLNFDQLMEQIGELIGNQPKQEPQIEVQPETNQQAPESSPDTIPEETAQTDESAKQAAETQTESGEITAESPLSEDETDTNTAVESSQNEKVEAVDGIDQNEIAETIKEENELAEKAVEEGIAGSMDMMPSMGQDDAIMGEMMPEMDSSPVEKAVENMSSAPKKKQKKNVKSSKSKAKTTKAKSTKSKTSKAKTKKKTTKSKKKKSEEVFV